MAFAIGVALTVVLAVPDAGALPNTAEGLLDQAKTAKKNRDLDRAAALLGLCLELEPAHADCLVTLGSTLATRGSAMNREEDNQQALVAYQRFLEVARADDPRRTRVREIIGNAPVMGGRPMVPPPPPPSRLSRPWYPPSERIVMPPRVTVALKASKTVRVSTIAELNNDNPATVDATLTDAATLKITGLKRGVANLKLYDPDRSWHAMRVEVK